MKRDKECPDQFAEWDRFMRHYTLTRDPHKALMWTRYERWAEARKREFLVLRARLQATRSLLNIDGKALESTTNDS